MKTLYIACIALCLVLGCANEETEPLAPLFVASEAAPAAAPLEVVRAATNTSLATSAKAPAPATCTPGLKGVEIDSNWLGGDQDGWNGTGQADPKELAGISNADMLAQAMTDGAKINDRWHALVSVGRRKVPGALQAFKAALAPGNSIQVREMALNGMIEHGGPEVLALFWDVLRSSEDELLRGKAIWGIAAYTPKEAENAIRIGLEDDSGSVVGMAVLAIASLVQYPEVALPMLEEAAQDKNKYAWQEAATVLATMPYADAANILERTAGAASSDRDKRRFFVSAYRDWRRAFPELCQ